MFENCGSCFAAERFVNIKSGANMIKNTEIRDYNVSDYLYDRMWTDKGAR